MSARPSLVLFASLALSFATWACSADTPSADAPNVVPPGASEVDATNPSGSEGTASSSGGASTGSRGRATRMPGSTPEGEVFWQTFAAGNYDALDQLQTTLGQATKKAPSDGYLQRLLGVSYFWQVAEGSRTSGGVFRDALASFNGIEALEASKAKSPNDPWTPCFLGLLKYEVGSRLGNTTQKEDGLRELARGIELYPEFNTYCRALARGGAPRSSPEFQAAVTDFWRVIELCDPTVTRDHPEVSDPSKMASCTIRARVPHGYNGIWMTMGDVMTKVGDARIANAFYANAKLAYFDNWPEKAALEKRLASQAQNQALFADADTKNDPELAFHSARTCVMCHAK